MIQESNRLRCLLFVESLVHVQHQLGIGARRGDTDANRDAKFDVLGSLAAHRHLQGGVDLLSHRVAGIHRFDITEQDNRLVTA